MPEQAPDANPLDALRAQGASVRDPVRFRLAEALARRASGHAGAAREAIDARLAAVLQGLGSEAVADDVSRDALAPTRAARGPLALLVADAARQKPLPVLGAAAKPRDATPSTSTSPAAAKPTPAPALDAAARTLQFFKRTWSRLSADQRLAQSRATLPDNAGPLNSHHLVHRALTLMQSLSPEYLEHFVGYVDALQWLEQANEATASAPPRRSAALRR